MNGCSYYSQISMHLCICDMVCKKGTMGNTIQSQSHNPLTYLDDTYTGNYPADLYEDKITENKRPSRNRRRQR